MRCVATMTVFRYFDSAADNCDSGIRSWWHNKLADYFEFCTNLQRKVEVRWFVNMGVFKMRGFVNVGKLSCGL